MLLKNKRVFIVEDNRANRTIMQLLLERNGAVVRFERWGHDTCERIQAFMPVDVILLDLMFPDNVTGYDVFDRIRKVSDFAKIPIVAVSAAEVSVAVQKTREKGFAGFISKPIDFLLFPQQVATIIRGESIWQNV